MSHSTHSQQSFRTVESAESATAATSIESAESTTAATPAAVSAARDVSPPPVVDVAPAARDVSPPSAASAARDVSPPSAASAARDMEVDDVDVHEVPECIASMIDRGSVESHRLFLARRTAMEMLRDRGYSVPEAEIARTLPEFRAWWAEKPGIERLAFTTTLVSDPSKKVQLVFCPPEPVKIATIREIYLQTKEENLSRLILILQSKILSRAREAIKEIFKFKVDIFQATDLLVNITKHVLKPKHEVLSADQKAKLLKEYNVEDSQLPRMLETDAVARYYGFDKGTVVKVTYDSELTGKRATDLLVNITKHVLKPKHEVLSADQKAKLLKEYNVEDSQLPRMLETDAVARYYGFDKGTVVKVTYDSELTGKRVLFLLGVLLASAFQNRAVLMIMEPQELQSLAPGINSGNYTKKSQTFHQMPILTETEKKRV
uniref:RNA polymerase subunit H/Rpb5 C-terminal domain-containing protein n=1 Tax=Oryza punctata TaxID=4537 RepID=A0A0E0MCC4_ORYPU